MQKSSAGHDSPTFDFTTDPSRSFALSRIKSRDELVRSVQTAFQMLVVNPADEAGMGWLVSPRVHLSNLILPPHLSSGSIQNAPSCVKAIVRPFLVWYTIVKQCRAVCV